MRRLHRKLLAALLAGLMIGGAALAFASTLGDELRLSGVDLAEGVALARGVYWNSQYSDKLAENYIEFTPGGVVKPVVVYGSMVSNYGRFDSMASLLNRRGQYVIGGMNGDYYEVANYVPLGILITDGELKSAERNHQAVGFRADGTAFIGTPGLDMSVTINGEWFSLAVINKIRPDGGYALFTEDFAPTTKNELPGTDVIMSVVEGELRVNCEVRLVVDEIRESKGAIALPEGKMVLSLSEKADEWRQGGLESLEEGSEIILKVKSAEPVWDEAVYALGTFCRLIENGAIAQDLDSLQHPRSAVGIRPDGTILLYTIDGRQPGLSAGVGTQKLAERLLELGCVEAGLIDGGGSTSLNALYIGNESISQINSPSGGSQRSVSNYIMLVTEEEPDLVPARLGLYPYDVMLLSGAEQSFRVRAADRTGRPAALPGGLYYELSGGFGEFDPGTGTYKAGAESGSEILTVTDGLVYGSASLTVVNTPDSITAYRKGSTRRVDRLDLAWGDSVSLTAASVYNRLPLVSDESCYIWAASEEIGEIDESGEFKAARADAEGTISITAGERTIQIPVTVTWPNPFSDVGRGDWFYKPVQFVYEEGLFTGVGAGSFAPRDNMTRGMFVTVLGRLAGAVDDAGDDQIFPDVGENEYFSRYVAWAYRSGLVNGYEDGTFRPEESITREQLCALLMRYAAYMGSELEEKAERVEFEDADEISDWARSSVEDCQIAGLVQGIGGNVFDPQGTAARAEVAAILMRFSE